MVQGDYIGSFISNSISFLKTKTYIHPETHKHKQRHKLFEIYSKYSSVCVCVSDSIYSLKYVNNSQVPIVLMSMFN